MVAWPLTSSVYFLIWNINWGHQQSWQSWELQTKAHPSNRVVNKQAETVRIYVFGTLETKSLQQLGMLKGKKHLVREISGIFCTHHPHHSQAWQWSWRAAHIPRTDSSTGVSRSNLIFKTLVGCSDPLGGSWRTCSKGLLWSHLPQKVLPRR